MLLTFFSWYVLLSYFRPSDVTPEKSVFSYLVLSQRKIKEGGPAKKAEGWTSNLEAFNPPLTSRSTTITLLISFSPTGEEIKTESTRKKSNFSF